MAIDVFEENLLTFGEVTKILPRRKAGKKAHTSTIYRWATRGLRGICLETVQIGGSLCTSKEALQRFFDNLHAVLHANHPAKQIQKQEKAIIDAERRLIEAKF